MSTFFNNVPIWVLPLFILLLLLGLRASKDRTVPIFLVYALPLLGFLTLNNIFTLSPPIWIWIVVTFSYGTGVYFGMMWQRSWIIERHPRTAAVKGEWVTLITMMLIFAAGFINGTLTALLPEIAQSSVFITLFSVVTCIASGQFLGRAITLHNAPTVPAR